MFYLIHSKFATSRYKRYYNFHEIDGALPIYPDSWGIQGMFVSDPVHIYLFIFNEFFLTS